MSPVYLGRQLPRFLLRSVLFSPEGWRQGLWWQSGNTSRKPRVAFGGVGPVTLPEFWKCSGHRNTSAQTSPGADLTP